MWRVSGADDAELARAVLTLAGQALRALGDGETGEARRRAAAVVEFDRYQLYVGFDGAVDALADVLDAGGSIDAAGWDTLEPIAGLGPLRSQIDELRGR